MLINIDQFETKLPLIIEDHNLTIWKHVEDEENHVIRLIHHVVLERLEDDHPVREHLIDELGIEGDHWVKTVPWSYTDLIMN